MGWFRKINKNGEDYKPIGNVITATSLSVTGPDLADGDVVRVMFTTDIAGSDTSTPLALTWNSGAAPIPVKAMKNGSLVGMYAIEYAANLYRYISAYATLELAYDATNAQFVVVGNPVVLSGSNYTIYADGWKADATINEAIAGNMRPITSSAVYGNLESMYAYIRNQNILSDYEGLAVGTMSYDGESTIIARNNGNEPYLEVYVNNNLIQRAYSVTSDYVVSSISFSFKKGDVVSLVGTGLNSGNSRMYKLRDYTGR